MSRRNGRPNGSVPLTVVDGAAVAPPQDLAAEQGALGAVLIGGGEAVVERLVAETGLEPHDFYRSGHGEIFATMLRLQQAGVAVDTLTLVAELDRLNLLEQVGGKAAIDLLAAAVPNAGNVLHYGRLIREKAIERRCREAAFAVAENPADGDLRRRLVEAIDAAEMPVKGSPHAHRKLDLAEVMALSEEQPPWRCAGLAADGHVTTLVGRGGEGKSLISLALAGAVQSGGSIAGIECKAGKVVIFDAENGRWVIGDRLKKAGIPVTGLDYFDGGGLDLVRHRSWITDQCSDAQLVIFDSIRTLAPGAKENDSDDMAPVMSAIRHVARETGAAVIAIHHRGKAEADFRGSSAIRDQTDLMFVLERAPRDPEARWRRALRCAKCRIAEEPPTRWVGIRHAKGEIYFTEAAAFEEDVAATPVRDELREQILTVIAGQGPISRGDIAAALGRSRKDGTVRRAMEDLHGEQEILELSGNPVRYVLPPGATGAVAPPGTPGTAPAEEGGATLKGNGTLAPLDGRGGEG